MWFVANCYIHQSWQTKQAHHFQTTIYLNLACISFKACLLYQEAGCPTITQEAGFYEHWNARQHLFVILALDTVSLCHLTS